MKRDYSNVPTSKVVKNITEDKIKFDLRDNWKQVPVEIEPNDSIEITVETSEALALLETKVEELGLEITDGGTTPVKVPVESVSLNENTANLFVGQTLTLVATITPNNATNKQCTWSSTDDTKATVVDGVVTAKATGNVVISVQTVDGNKTASCDVTITIAEVADETSLRDAITNGATEVKLTDNITVPSGKLDVTPQMITVLLEFLDTVKLMLQNIVDGKSETEGVNNIDSLKAKIKAIADGNDPSTVSSTPSGRSHCSSGCCLPRFIRSEDAKSLPMCCRCSGN